MFGSLKTWLTGNAGAPETVAAGETTPPPRSEFLAGETIHDRNGRPRAHLFRLRGQPARDGTSAARLRDFDRILLDTLNAAPETWQQTPAYIPIQAASLDLPAVDALHGEKITLLLHLTADDRPDTARLRELRKRGMRIGLFRQPDNADFAALMQDCDCAAIDAADCEPVSIRDFSAAVRATRGDPPSLLICNLGSLDEYRLGHQWHYDLLHGHFAVNLPPRPETVGDPHRMILLELIRLAQGDADNASIADAMKQDPMLGFRLLRYLNSPLLGLDHQIDSLNQALTVLGRQQLTRWLAVLLFSVREPDFADWWLVESALTRGRMMELLGQNNGSKHCDALFLTGIFSRLDRLLRQPLAAALKAMPLTVPIRAALLARSGPYAKLLTLAETAESFDTERIDTAAREAGLDAAQVNRALLAATAWTSDVTEHWT